MSASREWRNMLIYNNLSGVDDIVLAALWRDILRQNKTAYSMK